MSRVYVLGAGCSYAYGYPLADGFVPQLQAFGQALGPDAAQIKQCVSNTVALMDAVKVKTIDQLTNRIHQGRCDDPGVNSIQKEGVRDRRVREAKIATTALFLSKEKQAHAGGLSGYHGLLDRLFPDGSTWHRTKVQDRVLSFNYDRLFELAFIDHYNVDTAGQQLYYLLNSGLNQLSREIQPIEPDGFAFLKLHGSVGMSVHNRHGHFEFPYWVPQPGADIEIRDKIFFSTPPSPFPAEPLIAFPHERDFALGRDSERFPMAGYIKNVWAESERIMSKASEIWLVGYRCASPDRQRFMDLLSKAKPKHVVVVAPNAEDICTSLAAQSQGLSEILRTATQTFEACFV